jgi:hypothetical protein
MAVQAQAFEEFVATGETSHVQDVEKQIDRLLNDRGIAHMAVLNTPPVTMDENHPDFNKRRGVKLSVFMKITEDEVEELKQLYVDSGWRDVKITLHNTLGLAGTQPGFVFEANFS